MFFMASVAVMASITCFWAGLFFFEESLLLQFQWEPLLLIAAIFMVPPKSSMTLWVEVFLEC